MDEEALLKQFAAQFAHGPDDADDTDVDVEDNGAEGAEVGAAGNRSRVHKLTSQAFRRLEQIDGMSSLGGGERCFQAAWTSTDDSDALGNPGWLKSAENRVELAPDDRIDRAVQVCASTPTILVPVHAGPDAIRLS